MDYFALGGNDHGVATGGELATRKVRPRPVLALYSKLVVQYFKLYDGQIKKLHREF